MVKINKYIGCLIINFYYYFLLLILAYVFNNNKYIVTHINIHIYRYYENLKNRYIGYSI